MPRFAHVSDLHLPPMPRPQPHELAGKRLLGYLSWHSHRRRRHRADVLEALLRDLLRQAPDHVCVTGDLTNLGLAAEIDAAATWLRRLGDPADATVVPGNHDVYARGCLARVTRAWAPWMTGDAGESSFPILRRRGPLAFIGLSTGIPAGLTQARGYLGPRQIERLGRLLEQLRAEGLQRILLLHHPPHPGGGPRGLIDARALRRTIGEAGAELILHGHTHRAQHSDVPGPHGPVPTLGVSSASLAAGPGRAGAQYQILTPRPGGGFELAERCYDPRTGGFVDGPAAPAAAVARQPAAAHP